ncbi:MAG TPA: response regulator transcription factor [Chloroflexota bacterium]|jgi:DNA-binding response OmpR family regulator|nr:response regulator transcription factor [Chloroflexota bacterium]
MIAPAVAVNVLVVDDKASVRDMIRDYFLEQGYGCLTASNGLEALASVRTNRPDIILLDVTMPEMDGHQFLVELRRNSKVPVIMLTARVGESDRIVGLELGADDYVTKPFSLREVKARVQAVLRRTSATAVAEVTRAGGVTIDRATHEVEVDGRQVELTPSEFELLGIFAAAPGRVFSRQDLLNRMAHYDGSERTVDVHVRNLRSKLEDDPAAPKYIETVFGVGYRFKPR